MRAMKRVAVAVLVAVALGWVAYGSRNDAMRGAQATAQSASVAESADSEPDTAPASPAATPIASPRGTASPAPAPAATTAHDAPLPPLDEPFAQHLDELRARARDGDAPAACRLGMQLSYCSALPGMRRNYAEEVARQAAVGAVDHASSGLRHDSLALMEAQCRGVTALDPLEAYRMQLAAARAGIAQAQLQLAVFPPLDHIDVLDHVEVWREWRASALAALESALASGDPRAPLELARAYGDRELSPWTPRLAQPDPYRAFLYSRLSTMVIEPVAKSSEDLAYWVSQEHGELLTNAERERAAREASRLFESAYAGLPAAAFEKNQLNGNDFADCER